MLFGAGLGSGIAQATPIYAATSSPVIGTGINHFTARFWAVTDSAQPGITRFQGSGDGWCGNCLIQWRNLTTGAQGVNYAIGNLGGRDEPVATGSGIVVAVLVGPPGEITVLPGFATWTVP